VAQALTKKVFIGDAEVAVFSPRYLGMKLHRGPQTIRRWEWKKVIPKPILKTKDGWRWYTEGEIEIYERIAEEEQVKPGKGFGETKFTERVFAEIQALKKRLEKEIRA